MALIKTVDMGVIPDTGGIRRGVFLSKKGPSKYDFLISGVHDCTWRDGLRFEFDGFEANIVINGMRRDQSFYDALGEDTWEFTGYVPRCGVSVFALYSLQTRKGVFHLWPCDRTDYGCAGARQDLQTFFRADRDGGEPEMAFWRAMEHMADGSLAGCFVVRCQECWDLYVQIKQAGVPQWLQNAAK